jgi:hypothetical protein
MFNIGRVENRKIKDGDSFKITKYFKPKLF